MSVNATLMIVIGIILAVFVVTIIPGVIVFLVGITTLFLGVNMISKAFEMKLMNTISNSQDNRG